MIKNKKSNKENNLLNAAFKLFIEKGIKNTSIQEIVDEAGVGKGTFYLYFKDKFDLQEQLIAKKSNILFTDALKKMENEKINKFDDQIIFVINYIIDELTNDLSLLNFISKNLSFGLYNEKINKLIDDNGLGIKELFIKRLKDEDINIDNPEVTLYMIIELASSTCFSCIMKNEPLSINDYKPYLYQAIRKLLK